MRTPRDGVVSTTYRSWETRKDGRTSRVTSRRTITHDGAQRVSSDPEGVRPRGRGGRGRSVGVRGRAARRAGPAAGRVQRQPDPARVVRRPRGPRVRGPVLDLPDLLRALRGADVPRRVLVAGPGDV